MPILNRKVSDTIMKLIGEDKLNDFAYNILVGENHISFFVVMRQQYLKVVKAPDGLYRIEIVYYNGGKRFTKPPRINIKPENLSEAFSEIVDPM